MNLKMYVLEHKDLDEPYLTGFFAYNPDEIRSSKYDIAGILDNMEPEDLKTSNGLELACAGEIEATRIIADFQVMRGIDGLCRDNPALDRKMIMMSGVYKQISDMEIVQGDVYILRFKGVSKTLDEDMQISFGYVVGKNDHIQTDGKDIYLNDKRIELPKSEFQFVADHIGKEYDGKIETFRAGTIQVHRKMILPYNKFDGTYGSVEKLPAIHHAACLPE